VKRKRFSVEQIVGVLKQAEVGVPVAELIRKVGVSEQTYYRWKKQYTGLEPVNCREDGKALRAYRAGRTTRGCKGSPWGLFCNRWGTKLGTISRQPLHCFH
jgi:hypothetical protein